MQLILVIGAPGSGKTTDAQLIAKRHPEKFGHFSTGDVLRAEVASGSELGKEIDRFVSNGELVPLDIIVHTIETILKNTNKEVVLIDGFPRSVEQMEALDKKFETSDVNLKAVIEVDVSEEVAKDRILGRARGADDNEKVFNNRMKVYTKPLKDIQEFYGKKGLLKKINGERTIEEIVDDIDEFIHSIL